MDRETSLPEMDALQARILFSKAELRHDHMMFAPAPTTSLSCSHWNYLPAYMPICLSNSKLRLKEKGLYQLVFNINRPGKLTLTLNYISHADSLKSEYKQQKVSV